MGLFLIQPRIYMSVFFNRHHPFQKRRLMFRTSAAANGELPTVWPPLLNMSEKRI